MLEVFYPYCCEPPLKLCDDVDCSKCKNKSFASHPKAKYWSEKNIIKPRDVFKNSKIKIIFKCSKGHEFQVAPGGISSQQRWCPQCVNKTEQIFYDEMIKLYKNMKFQPRMDWCRNTDTNNYLPFDYILEDQKIIIELDGNNILYKLKIGKHRKLLEHVINIKCRKLTKMDIR